MAEFSKLITTKQGHALIAKLIAGEVASIDFPVISISSKAHALDELENLTSLDEIKQTNDISRKSITNSAAVQLEAAFSNETLTEGYYIRTLGLYADDPEGNRILYAAAIETSGSCYMPPYNGITVSGAYITLVTEVGNSENVSLVVNPAAFATVGNIDEIKALLTTHEGESVLSDGGIHGLRIVSGRLQYLTADDEWKYITGEVVSIETCQKIAAGTFTDDDPDGTTGDEGNSDIASDEDISNIIDNLYKD